MRLKKLTDQVMLITGASSGIGLTTARMAAKRGAKVMLVARSVDALREVVQQITDEGGEAVSFAADVALVDELRKAAEQCVQRFGRIDTWVNNAGVSIFGEIENTELDDDKRLFETNFWGVVNGSRIALECLRRDGGAIINVGSVVSERAVPMQGMYSASKHAVLGFTDALRMEIEHAGLPISVTTIKPSAINTPYTRHAQNYMETEPNLPPPVYEPEMVAEQILHAATHPVRQLYAGGGGWLLATLGSIAPRLMDWYMEATMFSQQRSKHPPQGRDSLHTASNDPHGHGDLYGQRMVRKHSAFNVVNRHPWIALAAIGAVGAVATAWMLAPEAPPQSRWRREAQRYGRAARDYAPAARKLVSSLWR